MKKVINGIQIAILLVFIFYSEFYRLGALPFRIWDESRLVTSAYEMIKNGKLLTPTCENTPDMWSTKPPLMIWAEACCIKLNGFSEFSARFPAALCGTLTIFVTVLFVLYITSNRWIALLSGIVLCTSNAYIAGHTTRYAEYDSMLMFFTTIYLISFFLYTESRENRRDKYLLLFFLGLTLAALTKGIAALLFAPSLFIYLLFRKQVMDTLRNRYFYAGAIIFVFFVVGYYLLREHYNPGYIKAVSYNEWGGRFNTTQGLEPTPWNYYWNSIRFEQFNRWYWGLPVALITIWFLKNQRQRRLLIFCLLNAFLFLAIISTGQTKLSWYDLSVFPLFALVISIVVFQLGGFVSSITHISKQVAIVLLIIIFSIQPVREAKGIVNWHDELYRDNFYAASYYFRDAIVAKRNLNNTIYFSDGYNLQWRLYVKMLNDKGVRIEDRPYNSDFKSGDKVIVNQESTMKIMEAKYNYKVLDEFYGVKEYVVTSVK